MESLARRVAGGVRAGLALRGASDALCLLVRARCVLLALALVLTATGAAAPFQRAVVPLSVNTVPKGDVLALLVGDDVLLKVGDLSAAGVGGFQGRRESHDGEEWVSLASLAPDVSYRLDPETVSLAVTVPPTWLAGQVLDLSMPKPAGLVYLSSPSLFANYAVNVTDLKTWNAFGEAGLSIGGDLFYSSVLRGDGGSVVRGLTNVTHDDRARLVRWVAGDTFAAAGSLGGSVFLAGLSASRSFDLDPYFSRYPSFALTGAATTPSTVDVYVNGNIVKREAIGPGTFQLSNILLPAGSGTTRVVVRDVFGQEREMTSGFYASTAVLAKGLSEFTYNLGFRRDDLSTESWDYGSLSFLGRHRYGFTDSLTAELRLEADDHLVSGGPGFAWRLPFGEVEGYVAASRERGRTGGAASLSYRYVGQPVNYGVFARTLSPHYAALGLSSEQDRPRWDGNAFVGIQLGRLASLTLAIHRNRSPRHAVVAAPVAVELFEPHARPQPLPLVLSRVPGIHSGKRGFRRAELLSRPQHDRARLIQPSGRAEHGIDRRPEIAAGRDGLRVPVQRDRRGRARQRERPRPVQRVIRPVRGLGLAPGR